MSEIFPEQPPATAPAQGQGAYEAWSASCRGYEHTPPWGALSTRVREGWAAAEQAGAVAEALEESAKAVREAAAGMEGQ